MITILLEHGADRTIPDIKGVLPYEVANELGYAQCREMLKEPPPPIMLASVSASFPFLEFLKVILSILGCRLFISFNLDSLGVPCNNQGPACLD